MELLALAVLAVSLASAQSTLLDSASFGHQGKVSTHRYGVPSWLMSGSNDWKPEIMTDKIILTPVYPGARQGAMWTDEGVPYPQWNVDFEFRASGPEHGGGNLQLWYTKEGQAQIGTNSIYTVGKFEGLVVVADMQGGRGGSIRAFLNDGTEDFRNHGHLEALAFGHCDYPYRNLGRPSKLTLTQDATGFEVKVDDRRCFRSDDVILPPNNFFGVTAVSSETPDSFELFKFITTYPSTQTPEQPVGKRAVPADTPQQAPADIQMQDALASSIKTQQAQFEDLHGRVQAIGHQVEIAIREIQRTSSQLENRLESLAQQAAKARQVEVLETRVQNLENALGALRKDQKDYTSHFNDIHASLKARHDTIMNVLPESMGSIVSSRAPNMGIFIFLLVGFQLMLVAAYVVYKRRLANGPKKYL